MKAMFKTAENVQMFVYWSCRGGSHFLEVFIATLTKYEAQRR
jgi:hypothetical protein